MFKISIKEFALLAADVYNYTSNYASIGLTSLPTVRETGWKFIVDTKLPRTSFHSSFFARTYVRFNGKTAINAVIAFRGTIPSHPANLIDDAELYLNRTPDSAELAQAYFGEIIRYLIERYRVWPKLTGHSLGGALAQLVAIHSHVSPQTVVFNSPGIGQLVDTNYYKNYDYIHNINSENDIIHSIGMSVGSVSDLNVDTDSCSTLEQVARFKNIQGPVNSMVANAMQQAVQSVGVHDIASCEGDQHSIDLLIKAIDRQADVANEAF